jgi:(p)ppGpp synthase/HD superfamily hydrolase
VTELEIAESIARHAHAGQIEESTGDDYIRHVERVVTLVEGNEAKAVAWLHDVIEDSVLLDLDLYRASISARVVKAVVLLTITAPDSYADYIEHIKDSGDELAIAVKLADLKDHLRPNCPLRLRPRYEKAWKVLTAGKDL